MRAAQGRLLAQPPLDPKGTNLQLDCFPAHIHGTDLPADAVVAGNERATGIHFEKIFRLLG